MRFNAKHKNTSITSGAAPMIILLLATIMAVFATASVAFAGEVSYEGEADGFVFSPGGSDSPTNLFTGMDSVMPGDELTDTVDVANNSGDTVKIYMRALGASDDDADFLSQLDLTVDKSGDSLFDAPADQQGGLADWVLLGSMSPGAKATLNLTVNVPKTMGNDYQNATGDINWQFKAEVPDKDNGDDPSGSDGGDKTTGGSKTNTGDRVMLGLVIAILAAAAIGAIAVMARRRRQ